MEALNVFWKQVLKDFDKKAPGWFPLLFLVLLLLQLSGLPENIKIDGWTIPLSAEVIASVITFILYQLGDAIDELIFKETKDGKKVTKKFYKDQYAIESSAAQNALGVGESGLYGLASKLTAAAEKERKDIFVYLLNESAKFLRSLIVPFLLLSIYFVLSRNFVVGVLLFVLSVIVLYLYPWLKVRHIKQLYKQVAFVTEQKKYYDYKDINGVRLYFWDRKYIETSLVRSSVDPTDIES
jgi:hypothetical protein